MSNDPIYLPPTGAKATSPWRLVPVIALSVVALVWVFGNPDPPAQTAEAKTAQAEDADARAEIARLAVAALPQEEANALFNELTASRVIGEMITQGDTALVTVFPVAFNGLSVKEKNVALTAAMRKAIGMAPDVGTVVVSDATNMKMIGIFRPSHGYHGF